MKYIKPHQSNRKAAHIGNRCARDFMFWLRTTYPDYKVRILTAAIAVPTKMHPMIEYYKYLKSDLVAHAKVK